MKSFIIFGILVTISLFAPSIEACKAQGLSCKDCNTLTRCIEEGSGYFQYTVQVCNKTAGEYCLNDHECSKAPNPVCRPTYTFQCPPITGVYPDPFNCKLYHYCVYNTNGKQYQYTNSCFGDYAYNMETTYCDIPAKFCSTTSLPFPTCKTEGQMGALKNKSFWYKCEKSGATLVAKIHVCPHGKIFSGTTAGMCVVPKPSATTTVPSSTDQ